MDRLGSYPQRRQTLSAALQRLRAELHEQQPPEMLPAGVFAALQGTDRSPAAASIFGRIRRILSGGAMVALAATIAGMGLLIFLPEPEALSDEGSHFGGFIRVAPADQWPQTNEATAWVLRTELSSISLAALGLPYDPGRAAEPVPAELLMHGSGEVLAVRFLP
jgi:hypothetical protein